MTYDHLTDIIESLEDLTFYEDGGVQFEVGQSISNPDDQSLWYGENYLGPIRGHEGHSIVNILNALPALIAEVHALRKEKP